MSASAAAMEGGFGMQVGKTLDQTNVKTLMNQVRQSRSCTKKVMPRQLSNNLKSEAFILKRSIPAQHVFAIRRTSHKPHFQKDRFSIVSAQRQLQNNQSRLIGSEFNLGIQNRIVQRLMSRLSEQPASPSRVERVVSAPQFKEPQTSLSGNRNLTARKTVSQGRKRRHIPQETSSPKVSTTVIAAPTTSDKVPFPLQLNDIMQIKPTMNLDNSQPMTPSIFDHDSPRTPFSQTYNFFAKENDPTVKVVYQAPYHSNSRLYDQAKRKQLKSRYLQQEAERNNIQKRITTTDMSEKHQPMETKHTKDQNTILNRLLKSNATTRQQFQNLISEQKARTNQVIKDQTKDVMQDILKSPKRQRPMKRLIGQAEVSLPRHRRVSMLNELQTAAATGVATSLLPYYGSFSPNSRLTSFSAPRRKQQLY